MNSYTNSDRNFGWIFASASLLAVFVACLGLWIVTLFSTLSRLKEVGIRKVLGANKTSLFFVLTKELLLLTVLASAIGIPVSASADECLAGNVRFPHFAVLVDICSHFCTADADSLSHCVPTGMAYHPPETMRI